MAAAAPRQGRPMADQGIERKKTIGGNMNDDIHTSEKGLARYAREYFDSGIAAANVFGQRRRYERHAPAPVMFLIAHSIELALKSYLRYQGYSVSDIVDVGHNLETCWEKAREKDIEEHVELTEDELEILKLISELHSSTELRYIRTGTIGYPVFGPVQILASKILDAVCPMVGYK
jgi:hypothetical protein